MLTNWRLNFPLAFLNAFLLSLLCGACVCTWAVTVREHNIGFFSVTSFPYWLEIVLTVVLLDFVAWIWHVANHRWRLLWRFHAVHHSDKNFEASTAFRFHPGELLISLGVRLVAVTLTGLPLLGLILFEVVYGCFNLFVHSDIRLPVRPEKVLGLVFIMPSLHRIHHSVLKRQHNRNFGNIFSCWDRLGKTYIYANSDMSVQVGLLKTNKLNLGFRRILRLPFQTVERVKKLAIPCL